MVLSSTLVGWLLAGAFLAWGANYLWQCVQVVLAPGVPVEFDYSAPAGDHRVRAESVVVDPWARQLTARRVAWTRPDGSRLARAERIEAKQVAGVWAVRLSQVEASAVRLPSGSFEFERAIPRPEPGGPPPPPFRASLDRAVVRFEDRFDGPPVKTTATLSGLRWDQAGDDALAGFVVSWPGLERARVSLQIGSAGKTWVRADVAASDAVESRPVWSRWLDAGAKAALKDVRAARLGYTGLVEVSSAGRGTPLVSLDGRLVGSGIGFLDWVQGGQGSATVQGDLSRLGVVGDLDEPGRRARFEGVVAIQGQVRAVGRLDLRVIGDRALWPAARRELPSGARFAGATYRGLVDFSDRQLRLGGDVTLASATFSGEAISQARAKVVFDGRSLRADVRQAKWDESDWTGRFGWDSKSGSLGGEAKSAALDLARVSQRAGFDGLAGTVALRAVLGGTASRPSLALAAEGDGTVRLGDRQVAVAALDGRAKWVGERLVLQRLVASGPDGVVAVTGSLDPKTERLDLDVRAGGVALASLADDADGTGFFLGKVSGTFADPVLNGRVEAFDATLQGTGLPQVVALLKATKEEIVLTEIQGYVGAGLVSGRLSAKLRDGALDGELTAERIAVSDFFDGVVGTVAVTEAKIGGTLDRPTGLARFEGVGVVIEGIAVDSVAGTLRMDGSGDAVAELTGKVGPGALQATMIRRLEDGKSSLVASWQDVPLALLASRQSVVSVGGTVSGRADATSADGQDWSAHGTARVLAAEVDGAPVGSGSFAFALAEGIVTADGSVGTVERYLTLDSLVARVSERTFEAKMSGFNLRVEDLLAALAERTKSWDPDVRDALATASGIVSGRLVLAGPWNDPQADEAVLEITALAVREQPLGDIEVDGTWAQNAATVRSLTWRNGPGTLSAMGTAVMDGPLNAQFDLLNFDLSILNKLVPSWPNMVGTGTTSALLEGSWDDPLVTGSVLASVESFLPTDGDAVAGPFRVNLEQVTYSGGTVRAQGDLNLRGFVGRLSASVPLDALPEDATATEPVVVTATFDERTLDSLSEYLNEIDAEASDGTVQGGLSLTGARGRYDLTGRFDASAKSLGWKGGETYRDATASLTLSDGQARLAAAAGAGAGGELVADLSATLPDWRRLAESWEDALAAVTLGGRLQAKALAVETQLPGATAKSRAVADADVRVSGTAVRPSLGGSVRLSQLDAVLPLGFEQGPGQAMAVEPVFDGLSMKVAPGARITAGPAQLLVGGSGTLSGSIGEPDLRLPLSVSGGRLDLPSARLRVEPGGLIVLTAQSLAGGTDFHADVSLTARTRLSIRRFSGQYEAVGVEVEVRGDLLSSSPLQLVATSTAPDVSQAQILAALGQTGLIEAIGSSALGGGFNSEILRETLYGVAVPTVTRGLLDQFAKELGLDFIALDYNPFDQFSVSFGRTVAPGLTLLASRQLQQTPGQPLKFDLRLTYRPGTRDAFLSRTLLSIGLDQDSPWKVEVAWVRRF